MPMNFGRLQQLFAPMIREINTMSPLIVTIAGTNGKGETAHNFQKIALSSSKNYKVAMWTSPHVESYTERFVFNGERKSERDLRESLDGFEKLYPQNLIGLSFYELSFWLFCDQVIKERPDIIILEVGLGGRLDAVNMLDSNLVILTSISRDHVEFLGHTYREIVLEKLGVVRKNSKIIYSVNSEYLKGIINKHVAQKGVTKLKFVCPNNPKYKNYHERNLALAVGGFELLTGIKIKNPSEFASTSLGRGSFFCFAGLNFKFYNSHNLDGHREFLKSNATNSDKYIFLFFSRRCKKELMSIYSLYSQSFKGLLFLCGLDGHHKVLSKSEIIDALTPSHEVLNFSDHHQIEKKFKKERVEECVAIGSNFIQNALVREFVS